MALDDEKEFVREYGEFFSEIGHTSSSDGEQPPPITEADEAALDRAWAGVEDERADLPNAA